MEQPLSMSVSRQTDMGGREEANQAKVLKQLAAQGTPGAMLDAKEPAIGKSAVAQTAAEELKAQGLLGGVAKDPLILERSRRLQSEELIVTPSLFLQSRQHLVIVLDGHDECANRDAQCEFVNMISHYVRMDGCGLRFRWIISSRPEPHLRVIFSTQDCQLVCVYKTLEINDSEVQENAWRILENGFAEIRDTYPDQVAYDWPNSSVIRVLAERASGHLGFVSFLLRFIGDKYYDNPSGKLDVCLRFLEQTNAQDFSNPLQALDLLYSRILSDIPANILSTTQRLLGLIILYGDSKCSAVVLANFLGLDRPSFYSSLQCLHSVLLVPPASEAAEKPIRIYHASFSDYLKDPSRSHGSLFWMRVQFILTLHVKDSSDFNTLIDSPLQVTFPDLVPK
ncbi:hypothetical protein NP233_g240 [Leucocoprinus birnbaumii]|uniref:NACHT domain-containing protein n=1 Tax=Leucocoprinus birnbaumii TaxID=56174 RepID=A0AAD5YYR8_9AGAR|nr:hypothetical protein NP233_g240 [Leucocoprinus birnbaumii]